MENKQVLKRICACSAQTGEDRDVENKLVQLLDFDKFELIKELLKNRLKIVWCTRLQRAQAEDERTRIEVWGRLPCCLHAMIPGMCLAQGGSAGGIAPGASWGNTACGGVLPQDSMWRFSGQLHVFSAGNVGGSAKVTCLCRCPLACSLRSTLQHKAG